MLDIRLRSKIGKQELDEKLAKLITDGDYNVLLTGPAFVRKPDGRPLCIYLPGIMKDVSTEEVYQILHSMRGMVTDNRANASGVKKMPRKGQQRLRAIPVPSAVAGAVDKSPAFYYCRMTVWTSENFDQWAKLQPYLLRVAEQLKEYVPDRYEAQMEEILKCEPEWVVPNTPFTTLTINNTWPTAVHTDKGDLDKGFSSIACIRRGNFTGGRLTFPEYRVAVDLQDNDLILMDAHEWHGNTPIVCECGDRLRGMCKTCGAERISVVSYMRAKVVECGTAEEELDRAHKVRARREAQGVR